MQALLKIINCIKKKPLINRIKMMLKYKKKINYIKNFVPDIFVCIPNFWQGCQTTIVIENGESFLDKTTVNTI